MTTSHAASGLFAGENKCSVRLLLYYIIIRCSVSVRPGKVKNVHLLFAEILRHKPKLHDLGFVVFPSKEPGCMPWS